MPTQSPEARQSRHPGPQDLNQQRPSLAWPPQGLTQEAQELSTEKFGDLGSKTFKGQWREGSGPLALSPSQGTVNRLVLLLPSSTPLYVTMANPNVVLCRAKVPQGVRASWEWSTAGQKTMGQPGGAACRLLS